MNPRFWLPILVVSAALALCLAPSANADSFSISFIAVGNGHYNYGITIPANTNVTFLQNETITFTGLSGVTGASLTGDLDIFFTVQSFTSSSVTFVQSLFPTLTFVNFGVNVPFTSDTFVIDSTAPVGTVDWSGTANGTLNSGTVPGPVSSGVPEPSSLLLLAGGLTGLLSWRRKRIG
jgi:PEP-CTERM motif